MWWAFCVSILAVLLLFCWLLLERLATLELEDEMEELRELSRQQLEVEHRSAAPRATPAGAEHGPSH